jgi:peptidylprolyl isomerase
MTDFIYSPIRWLSWGTSWNKPGEGGALVSVKKGDIIRIHYRGELVTGEMFDDSFSREPIEFTVGGGQVISAIDEGVIGLSTGEKRTIVVTPENGYGERREDLVRSVPREMLGDQEVSPGEAVEIQTSDGQLIIAEVLEANDDSVIFDLNHPFAGRHLNFEIELVDIVNKAA